MVSQQWEVSFLAVPCCTKNFYAQRHEIHPCERFSRFDPLGFDDWRQCTAPSGRSGCPLPGNLKVPQLLGLPRDNLELPSPSKLRSNPS